jgi:hypothetical protein
MKKTIALLLVICTQQMIANTLYEQLCAFNPNWKKYHLSSEIQSPVFNTDQELIQTHLKHVIDILEANPIEHLSSELLLRRYNLVSSLKDYREEGKFPQNQYSEVKLPVFIDEFGTHCAVGHLIKASGSPELAKEIAEYQNYAWVKEITNPKLLAWQETSGFTLEELKLIQGVYDFYHPNALTLPNRIKIPQKPQPIVKYFDEDKSKAKHVWLKGESKKGKLHGSWEQNYGPDIPWIKGCYENGRRTGQWIEYYQGTKKVCRTENWRYDKLNGYRKRYDQEGRLIEEILFKKGKAIVKTNHNYSDSITWIRKPLDSNIVYSEMYTLGGALLASGNEKIHNPSNLMWFQNIELTSLNMMAISSKQIQSKSSNNSPLYNQPPLVEYKKIGTWNYYPNMNGPVNMIHILLSTNFLKQFSQIGHSTISVLQLYQEVDFSLDYDSVRINYENDRPADLFTYHQQYKEHLRFTYHLTIPILRNWQNWNENQYSGLLNTEFQIKTIGKVNEREAQIGVWKHYDSGGSLAKIEHFILPYKEEDTSLNLGAVYGR